MPDRMSLSHVRLPKSNDELQEQPQKRRRVALACDRCRDRKSKCDGIKPTCGSCQQLQQRQPSLDVHSCKYQDDIRRFVNDSEYIDALRARIHQLEQGFGGQQRDYGTSAPLGELVSHETNMDSNLPRKPFNCRDPDRISILGADIDEQNKMCSVPLPGSKLSNNSLPPNSQTPLGHQSWSALVPSFQDGLQDTRSTYGSSGLVQHRASSTSESDLDWPDAKAQHKAVDSGHSGSEGTKPADSDESISAMGATATIEADSPIHGGGFYGASSAISFFNQIQEALSSTGQPGSSHGLRIQEPIRDGQVVGQQLSTGLNIKLEDLSLPPRVLADSLLESYWDQVHSLYPIIHKSSFVAVYQQIWVPEETESPATKVAQVGLGSLTCPISVFYCGLNAMLALGCAVSRLPYHERRTLADSFCQRALDLALGNLLENNSLALVQALFILGQYLQSTDHPTRCWNVVGLALRVAQGIGLYMDKGTSDDSILETELKRRTWHGCLLLDIITSMTLGRPALASREAKVHLPAAVDDKYLEGEAATGIQPAGVYSGNTFFVQTIKLYAIFGEVLTHVYKPWQDRTKHDQQLDSRLINNIIKTVVDLENDMLDFKSNLPMQLNWDHPNREPGESWILERQRNILYTRFLHLKVLLYRPVFHQLCVQPRRNTLLRAALSEQTVMSLVIQRCSIACIESAQALIEFVDRSSQTRAAGAWWYGIFYIFTSAMILILADSDWAVENMVARESIEESWQRCLGTLDRFAANHIRAKACAKTLVKLRDQAIAAKTAMLNSSNKSAAQAANIPTHDQVQQSYLPGTINSRDMPNNGPFDDDTIVAFYDPLLQDVLWQQPDSQLPWDSLDADWWQESGIYQIIGVTQLR